jgi:NAD(P)-dependent dehydrogenase (short-subunit alcohol dehydrogenase family)
VRIDGKKVLLTGALGSLGRAQALRLAHAGAGMFLLDRPGHENGETFAGEVTKAGGEAATFVGQDLGDLAAAQDVVRSLAARIGGFDILINNAALIINRPFMEFSIAEYEEQMRLNASAGFALAQAVAVRSEAEDRVFGDRLQQYNDWVLDRQSVKERMQPDHVADLVLFLCASASDMITGQNIAIDGGW